MILALSLYFWLVVALAVLAFFVSLLAQSVPPQKKIEPLTSRSTYVVTLLTLPSYYLLWHGLAALGAPVLVFALYVLVSFVNTVVGISRPPRHIPLLAGPIVFSVWLQWVGLEALKAGA